MTDEERSHIEREIESVNMLHYLSVSQEGLKRVQKATEQDKEMSELKRLIQEGGQKTFLKFPSH